MIFPTVREASAYLRGRGYRYDWNRLLAYPMRIYRRGSDVAWVYPLGSLWRVAEF